MKKTLPDKASLIRRFNALRIPGMPEVTELYELSGSFVNLEYTLASGQTVKLWDDNKIYYGAELPKPGSERCYGLTADENYLMVCEYGCEGAEAAIVLLQRL